MKLILETKKYSQHNWLIYGDLEILTILLGQQSGNTKYPCFLCLWDSRDRKMHYVKKKWPSRTFFEAGSANIVRETLVNCSNVLLVKYLNKEGECFKYLKKKFLKLKDAWVSFKEVVQHFLENNKSV